MKRPLPKLVEQSLRESRSARSQILDQFEREQIIGKGAATCLKGCHHCCFYPVFLSILEGIELFRHLEDTGLWTSTLKRAFQKTRDLTWDRSMDVWLLSMVPCPVLDDAGLCRVYKSRPFFCRITASRGDPHYCHPHRASTKNTQFVPRTEYIEKFNTLETRLLKQHKLPLERLPLAAAVLFAEQVCKEVIELVDLPSEVMIDWIKRSME